MNLIPLPKKIKETKGTFTIKRDVGISISSNDDFFSATQVSECFKRELRISPRISSGKTTLAVVLKYDGSEEEDCYKISVTSEKIEISGSHRGIFYGVQTLCQLVREYRNHIPCMEIEDWQDFKARGFYYDVSRGRVPTLDSLKKLVDRLAYFKYNQFQLYFEHTFAFSFLSEAWSSVDAIMPEEILELDRYCQARHIELVPSIATFGHMHDILLTKSFGHLNELEEPMDEECFFSAADRHYTLNATNPESFELVKRMIDDFLPLFSSNKFNICGDETFDLGRGKNKELADKVGRGKLYVDFISKVIDYLTSKGKTVMMWSDVIATHPEYADAFTSKDIIFLAWGYVPEVKDERSKVAYENGVRQYTCPATHSYDAFINRYTHAYSNIQRQIQYGLKYEADGILLTEWGNKGAVCPISASMAPIAYCAELMWNTASLDCDIEEFEKKFSKLMYNNEEVASLLRKSMEDITMDWEIISFWINDQAGLYSEEMREYLWLETHRQNRILAPEDKKIREGYKKAVMAEDRLREILADVYEDEKDEIAEMLCGVYGTSLLYPVHLIVRKYCEKLDVEDTIIKPNDLAVCFESWLEELRGQWHKVNKPSDLKTFESFIKILCRILRNIED